MICRTRRYPGYSDSSGVSLNRGYELATPADCVRACVCVCVGDRLTIRLLPLLTLLPPRLDEGGQLGAARRERLSLQDLCQLFGVRGRGS